MKCVVGTGQPSASDKAQSKVNLLWLQSRRAELLQDAASFRPGLIKNWLRFILSFVL